MEPIPETRAAMDELALQGPGGVAEDLHRMAERVRAVVPDCVGMSLTMIEHGITLTFVATDQDIALLDALQYLDGGPCIRAVDDTSVIETDVDAMDEEGWRLFAQGSSAAGVSSTLSLPVMDGTRVVGGLNLYAASAQAFAGHQERLADLLGAWAGGAVLNSDLSFRTRQDAERAPQVLRDSAAVDQATGALARARELDLARARERLESSADRAGLPVADVARILLGLFAPHVADEPDDPDERR